MGVKFGREYEDIVVDLASAIGQISDSYSFFEMSENDWIHLSEQDRKECLETLADDIFFALGTSPKVKVGCGTLTHIPQKHVITVTHDNKQVTIVHLI